MSDEQKTKTQPNPLYAGDDETPTITINGQRWPVPLLTPRQNIHAAPAVLKLAAKMSGLDLDAMKEPRQVMEALARLGEDGFEAMVQAIYWSLKQAHPLLTREEFDSWPIPATEMIGAFAPIVKATGLFKKVETPGEALAAISPTGSA